MSDFIWMNIDILLRISVVMIIIIIACIAYLVSTALAVCKGQITYLEVSDRLYELLHCVLLGAVLILVLKI